MDLLPIAQLALLFLLLVLSALISGAEVAFFSLNNSDLDEKELTKGDTLNIIKHLLNRRKRLLATILITNNFINIAIVLIFASFRNFLFEGLFSPVINLLIEIGVITIIILLFGEILPKIYANRNPLGFAKFMSRPLKFLDSYILFFLTFPMSKMTYFFENRLNKKNDEFSVDQLSQALELTDEHETTKEEQKILQGIVNFGNIDTKEVMCPRIDVFAISTEESLKEILPKIMENGFSRIPVYREHLDKVEGILYIKDLLPHLKNFEFDWTKLLRPPFYVPENKKLDDLLAEFQQKKIHLAIVVDEYGGTSGLITLEDIIEEIVGDISDEFDEFSLSYSQLDKHNFVFDGKTNLKDFFRIIDLKETSSFDKIRGENETLGGLFLEATQVIPKPGQKFTHNGYIFLIERIDNKRIKRIKVTIPKS
ncbi:MAG: magnesium/cobalt efflux protein [Flavobacteriaceae bacterium]|nr:magnesium/cobalt efflux protein [Flavobacteriaceae bacterium]|tara:strand:- start:16208 stop:17479 length:1272 start_codon:yes stop_codon:yes gene_type:complete